MSDMTRQNAIYCMKAMLCEEACEDCDYYGKTGTDHCEADAVRMAIKALEEQPHWIPCSTALPKDEEDVIVSIHDDSGDYALDYSSFGWYAAAGEFWVVDNEANMCVTAWMSLPHPYREDDHDNT